MPALVPMVQGPIGDDAKSDDDWESAEVSRVVLVDGSVQFINAQQQQSATEAIPEATKVGSHVGSSPHVRTHCV